MEALDLLSIVESLYLNYGLPVIFLGSLFEITPFGWAIPGGTLIALGGFFSYGRTWYLFAVILFAWLGAWTTFIIAYLLGAGAAKKLDLKIGNSKSAKRAKVLLEKQGPVILTTSMLASITRFWIAFAAGAKRYDFKKYAFYSGTASLTWVSLMATVGFLAGSEREALEKGVAGLGIAAWLLFLIVAGFIFLKVKKEFKELQQEELI